MNDPLGTVYKDIGSDEPYFQLVEKFYEGVENDSVLRPLYPEDLTNSKSHLALFLIQRTGGRTTYSNERGHPRMRMRHMPFKIGLAERNAWVLNMNNALDQIPEFAVHRSVLDHFFSEFATFMINQPIDQNKLPRV